MINCANNFQTALQKTAAPAQRYLYAEKGLRYARLPVVGGGGGDYKLDRLASSHWEELDSNNVMKMFVFFFLISQQFITVKTLECVHFGRI